MGSRSVAVLGSYTSKQKTYLPLQNVGLVSHHTPYINFIKFYSIWQIESGTLKHLTNFCSRCPYRFRQQVTIPTNVDQVPWQTWCGDHYGYGPSQLVMTLHGNATPHWPSPHPEWSLMVSQDLNELMNNSVIYQLFKKFVEYSLRNICINSIFNNYIPDDCTSVFYTRFA